MTATVSNIVEPSRVFDRWAPVYDEEPNPVLSLEQRYLSRLRPGARNLDVLDAGCGTGRWLERLSAEFPNTLIGVDPSAAMLERASRKVPTADLRLGICSQLPVADASVDLVLSSFVLGYLCSPEEFARELGAVVRSQGQVFLSDLHPETWLARGWTRSFKVGGETTEAAARAWPIGRVVHAFRDGGFEVLALLEPSFGSPEQPIFERSARTRDFASLRGVPAIYILQLRKAASGAPRPQRAAPALSTLTSEVALGPRERLPMSVALDGGAVRALHSRNLVIPGPASSQDLDLAGFLLLPGLVNAHDHLDFGLFPRLGRGGYSNAADWAADIHRIHGRAIERHRRVPREDRHWWGALRNLLCGVTTVCHHNPLFPEILRPEFPVRVVRNLGWAHSLAMDAEVVEKHRATPPGQPFILHAAEGIDWKSEREIFELDRIGVLDERCVLVHGLALTRDGASLLNRRGASLIVCPTSNRFLFGRTPDLQVLNAVASKALGSDSPLTAAGDLLDDIRFAHAVVGLDPAELYEMVTTRPAAILGLRKGEGSIRPGAPADFLAIRDKGQEPADALCSLAAEQVELVLLSGCVQMASPEIAERLPDPLREGLECLRVGGSVRWVRAPLGRLFSEAEGILGEIQWNGKRVADARIS